jgi:serine/threonine protein kinase
LLGGRYRLGTELGSGGMGMVFRAVDEATGADVAVKVIKAGQDDPELVARFRRERVFTALHSPHIVRVLDHGDDDGLLYLVMELLRGETLRARLQRGELPVAEALSIARDLARALAVAHAAGIAHRDVKPANVMLTAESPSRTVLLDFGIARSLDPAATMTSTSFVVGTAGYIAPEIAMGGRAYDARADLYSLGIVLYEMLVGAPPFVAANPLALAARQASEDPRSPRARERSVPASVDALVMQLISRTPTRRPASADVLVDALEALLAGDTPVVVDEAPSGGIIDQSPYVTILWEPVARLVRYTRSDVPFAVADDVGRGYSIMRDAFAAAERGDKILLLDLRLGPLRADPRFVKIALAELPELQAGWRKVANVVRTDEGMRQLSKLGQSIGLPARLFFDEDAALAWLLSA